MAYYIGIDGGGTKTKFVLADGAGRVLAEHTGPTCHYLQCGTDGLTRVLADGIERCIASSAVPCADIAYIFAACAAFGDSVSGDALILPAIAKACHGIPFAAGNDSENALAGALGGAPGVNIIAGTGSIGFGKNAKGETARCGGWHHALGSDEGSGYWFACRMTAEYLRQSDGRDGKTALFELLSERLGIDGAGGLISRIVEEWRLDRTRIASLAPLAATLYDMGDIYALRFFNDAAGELSDIALAIARRLSLPEGSPVGCTGGVFNMGERIKAPLRSILASNGFKLTEPLLEPARGSVILAMQHSGIEVSVGILAALGADIA